MKFYLEEDIRIVYGYKNACIYDLSRSKLHEIQSDLVPSIKRILSEDIVINTINNEEKKLIEYLSKNKLISNEKKAHIKTNASDYKNTFCQVEVTTKCNHRCSFCYLDEVFTNIKHNDMSVKDFQKVALELKSIGVEKIQLIGGEALLLKDKLVEMIEFIASINLMPSVYTNGSLIDDEWIKIFKRTKTSVGISLHSYIPEVHDNITRIKGSHKKVVENIKKLKSNNIPVLVRGIRSKGIKLGEKTDDSFEIERKMCRVSGQCDLSFFDYNLFKQKCISNEKKSFHVNHFVFNLNQAGHPCFLRKLYVDVDQNVYPCTMERQRYYGSLKQDKLKDILTDQIRTFNNDKIATCKDCEYRYACFHCIPDSIDTSQTSKLWFCLYDPYTGEWESSKDGWRRISQQMVKNN